MMDIEDYGDLLEALQNDDEWVCEDVKNPAQSNTSSSAATVDHKQQNSADVSTPSAKHLEVLSKYFGHSQFRPLQWEIVYNILHHRRDICAIMSTGYGKSLCYQYPAVFSGGVVLVVSPLIALMEDQVLALKVANIAACFLGSAQSDVSTVTNDILDNKYSIVYVSPEYCHGEGGTYMLKRMNEKLRMTLIAVDEAHCVSQWGHDFRSSYRKVGELRKIFPCVPMLAVTATATPQVRNDICKSLKLRNPVRICSSFDRPNLFLSVHVKSGDIWHDIASKVMVKSRSSSGFAFEGSSIIYCPTRKVTETVTEVLQAKGISCDMYHAGMSIISRRNVHKAFVRDQIQVVVATIAFGMGIDKPDVRCIVHYGAPRDIESYYQEIGRAGRDNLPAACTVFYEFKDFNLNKFFLKDITDPTHLQHTIDMMQELQKYLENHSCRRLFILKHFEGNQFALDADYDPDSCCDVCRHNKQNNKATRQDSQEDMHDFTEDAKLLFKTVEQFKGKTGLGKMILALRGSNSKDVLQHTKNSSIFGAGKAKSEAWWKGLGRLLLKEKYLEECAQAQGWLQRKESGFAFTTIGLARKGEEYLNRCRSDASCPPLMLAPPRDLKAMLDQEKEQKQRRAMLVAASGSDEANDSQVKKDLDVFRFTRAAMQIPTTSGTVAAPLSEEDKAEQALEKQLFDGLSKVRADLALRDNIMPYTVANTSALVQLSVLRPSTLQHLTNVSGFNEAKIEKFGQEFLTFITHFCQEHNLKSNNFPDATLQSPPAVTTTQSRPPTRSIETASTAHWENLLQGTTKTTYMLFQMEKMPFENLLEARSIKSGTAMSHLCSAIKLGLPVDIDRAGLTHEKWRIIVKVIDSPPLYGDISKLTPIKERCPDFISWDDIKIVLCLLESQKSNCTNIESICPKFFETLLAAASSVEPVPSSSVPSASSKLSVQQTSEDMPPQCKKAKVLETEVPEVKPAIQKMVPVKCVGTSQMMFEDSD